MGHRLRWRTPLLLGVITVLGFGLRFYQIGVKTVWLDEAFSIWLAHQPLVEMWGWLIKIDQHPPLYYSLLHFWILLFGDAQGVARALSALCSGATIPIFYAACRYLVRPRTALVATLLLAFSPFQLRYAQETRMYALLTLTVALALYLLMVVLFDDKARRRWPWLGLALAQAAVMLTHNTATVFFPLALNGAVGGALLWQRWRGQRSALPALNMADFQQRWLRTQLLAVLAWSPWSIPFLLQSLMVEREFWIQPPTVGLLYETLHNFNFAFLPAWSLPMLIVNGGWWLLAALGVRALRQRPALVSLLLLLLLLPIVGELVVSLHRPIFADRTLIWVMLP
ncbi:MAG: glycosyltransferase family 39 protein, partial [Caldilineaceae bacterium]